MINAEYFKLIHRFTRHDHPKHPEIGGVLIEPYKGGGVLMAATTGAIVGAVWDPLGYCPVPICIRAHGVQEHEWEACAPGSILTLETYRAFVHMGKERVATFSYDAYDAFAYPDWRGMYPNGKKPVRASDASFDLQLLSLFGFNGGVDTLAMWTYDKDDMYPHLVTHDDYPTFVGTVMPYKADGEHMFVRPSWLG